MKKVNNRLLGNIGEDIAVHLAENRGLEIIQRNFRCRFGEIDIIARDKNTLVFIEVKARRSSKYGFPEEAVDFNKQTRIRSVASFYISMILRRDRPCRFDVYAIYLDENCKLDSYKIYENCF